ncbi:MAG: hypothetical protein NZ534_04715 [Bacteroidia bacterium]|nr:hypothetical protein [Bacteroidia bacterium]
MDEGGYFFYCEIAADRKTIENLNGRRTGSANEREFIRTVVLPEIEALPLIRSTSSLVNYFLYKHKTNPAPNNNAQAPNDPRNKR